MSTEFIRSFKFLTLFVALAMGTSIGHSCAVENPLLERKARQLDIRYWLPQYPVPSEAEVRSFYWPIKKDTGSTLIFDLNKKLVATIYTQKFDPYKGYFGAKFNVSEKITISQEDFGDILSAQQWVLIRAIIYKKSLQKLLR
ncbi:MAG: hypothetical protein WCN27_04955 [Alphaproteobacteria bacterium]